VHQATILTDRKTGRSKGFGFVDMPASSARNAVDALHGSKLGGRDLRATTRDGTAVGV
jgi:RNA recognition motif-containing protein